MLSGVLLRKSSGPARGNFEVVRPASPDTSLHLAARTSPGLRRSGLRGSIALEVAHQADVQYNGRRSIQRVISPRRRRLSGGDACALWPRSKRLVKMSQAKPLFSFQTEVQDSTGDSNTSQTVFEKQRCVNRFGHFQCHFPAFPALRRACLAGRSRAQQGVVGRSRA